MKNQKGFIQIPILIAIIAGVLVIGGASYLGVKQYQNYLAQKVEREKIAQEAQQQKDSEVENLKKEVEILKNQKPQVIVKEVPSSNEISAADLKPYLSGVIRISCYIKGGSISGSGSLWNVSDLEPFQFYAVFTNGHVVTQDENCLVFVDDPDNKKIIGIYPVDNHYGLTYNSIADFAILPLPKPSDFKSISMITPTQNLNYSLSNLRYCTTKMPQGSPAAVIGYPAFANQANTSLLSKTVTTGIISGFDDSVAPPLGNLPYPNYFISAKIDSGNSGGIALSKDAKGLCILGIPTWVSIGNYETQGVVQNIWNVTYEK